MANQTLFGIVELGEDLNRKKLSNATFRLHLGSGINAEDTHLMTSQPYCCTVVPWLRGGLDLSIHISKYASAGLIYERELHISTGKDHKSRPVLHLKEGARFFETIADKTFPIWFGEFLSRNIPELNQVQDH